MEPTAYNQANTANNTANGAYSQANGAYAHANIVYAQANAAYDNANTRVLKSGDTMTGNLNVSAFIITNNVQPNLNVTYDLGSPTKRYKNLYLSNNALHLGDAVITSNGSTLIVSGVEIDGSGNLIAAFDSYDQANTARDTANAAYNQANGAFNQANGAYAHANIVYAQANAAYDQANTARGTANDAYAQANTARDTGNNAYAQANTARDTANDAYNQANTARTTANDSYNQANTARNTANDAYNQANTARGTANDAYGQANAAYLQANNAYDEANLKVNVSGGTISGDLVVSGNLSVLGNSTTLNVETLKIEDNEIILNSNVTGSPTLDSFITINRGSSTNAVIKWDENTDQWKWSDGDTFFYAFDSALDAYAQANTARTTANDSYAQANTARNTANDSYAQANTARTTANDAYAQANTARTTANDSYAQANTARNTANDSYAQANTARTTANDAYGQANSAYNTANTANATANLAYAQANSNYQPAVTRLNVTNSGASAYLLDQYPGNNPTVYVRGGETLAFNLNVSGHPFMIRQSSGGANYNTGLTHVSSTGVVSTDGSAQGQVSGTLYWKVPYNIVGNTYVYQCSIHGGMVGNIVIEPSVIVAYAQANAAFDTANGAYAHANIVYAQANAAYNDANGAYAQANGAYAQANGAYSQANGAYAQANGAYAQANIVYAQANAAYEKANAPITVKEIYAGNSTVVNTYTNINTIQFDSDSGMAVVNAASNTVTIQLNSTFKNWNVDGNAGLVAVGLDTVNFIAGSGISIAANNNASPKSITFTSTGGGGGAANVVVKDEGTTLTSAVTSIDFTGGGVTATASGSNVTISVPVGLSNTIIKTVSYTSTNAAANLTYALPLTPSDPSYIFVIKNGIVLTPNTDYSLSGNTLTVIESGAANDAIEVRYFDQINIVEYPNTKIEVDSNTVTSQTNTFYVTSNVAAISRLSISKNGLLLTPNLHFTVTGNTVTLNTAAEINDVLTFTHIRNLGPLEEGSGLTEYNYNTSTSSVETVDSWSKNTYRSGKYQVQVESGAGYYATEIMVIHDDSTTNLIQYGTSSFGSNVGVFSSDISGSNVRLLFTATDSTSFVTYNRVLLTKRSSESLPTDLMTGSDAYDLMVTLPFNPTDLN